MNMISKSVLVQLDTGTSWIGLWIPRGHYSRAVVKSVRRNLRRTLKQYGDSNPRRYATLLAVNGGRLHTWQVGYS